jgi:hypothetical protein
MPSKRFMALIVLKMVFFFILLVHNALEGMKRFLQNSNLNYLILNLVLLKLHRHHDLFTIFYSFVILLKCACILDGIIAMAVFCYNIFWLP